MLTAVVQEGRTRVGRGSQEEGDANAPWAYERFDTFCDLEIGKSEAFAKRSERCCDLNHRKAGLHVLSCNTSALHRTKPGLKSRCKSLASIRRIDTFSCLLINNLTISILDADLHAGTCHCREHCRGRFPESKRC